MSARPDDIHATLVKMTSEHLPAAINIEMQGHLFPWSESIFYDCLSAKYDCWVYLSGDRMLGYSITTMAAGEGHILNICVDPEFQGRGYGKVLLENIFDSALQANVKVLFLEVRPSNHVAQALYDRYGFQNVGRREKYYPAKRGREDALIMAKVLFLDEE